MWRARHPSAESAAARNSAVDVWWMIGFMPAVGELVRCTDGSWMTRPPHSCPRGHLLRPGAMLVGHQPCSTCRGGHTTWTCLDCGGVVYGPPLTAGCRFLVGAAAVR